MESIFKKWIFVAIYHSLIIFYMAYFAYFSNDILMSNNMSADFSGFCIILTQGLVLVTNFKLWIETKYHSYWYIGSIWLSILIFVVTTIVYNIITIRFDTDIYFSYFHLLASIPFYLLSIFVIVLSLLPDYLLVVCKNALNIPKRKFFPGDEKLRRMRLNKLQRSGLDHLEEVQSTYL